MQSSDDTQGREQEQDERAPLTRKRIRLPNLLLTWPARANDPEAERKALAALAELEAIVKTPPYRT